MVDFKVADYGQEKDFDATDGELEIYQKIIDTISGAGFDASPVRLTAKSKGYLSAVIGPSDVARFKSSSKTQWVQLPYARTDSGKIQIADVSELDGLRNEILAHYLMAYAHMLQGFE